MRVNATFSIPYLPIYRNIAPQHTPQQLFEVPFDAKMSAVLFKLRNPDAKKETTIHVYYWYDGKRFVSSLRRTIHPDQWNSETMRPKKSYFSYQSLKGYLDKVQAAIVDKHNNLLAFGQYPTKTDFQEAVNLLTGKIIKERPTLFNHLDKLCDQAPTRSMYHRLRTQVKRFTKNDVLFSAITKEWFDKFQAFLISSNSAESYAYRLSKQFRTSIRRTAFDFRDKTAILNANLQASDTPSESIYLNTDELLHLYNCDLSGKLSDVRYMTLFTCLTGLRISDWPKVDLTNQPIIIDGMKFYRVVSQKTRSQKKVIVSYPPILPITETILKKYNGVIPSYWKHVQNSESFRTEFNKALRTMAEEAKFTNEIEIVKRSKGETFTATHPKYERFSSKIGRKSFISNLRGLGMPKNLVNVMTGHTTDRQITDVYDARKFEEIAPQLLPYLKKYDDTFPSDYGLRFI